MHRYYVVFESVMVCNSESDYVDDIDTWRELGNVDEGTRGTASGYNREHTEDDYGLLIFVYSFE